MADRRYDDDRRVQDDRRQDPDRERRIQRRADVYRGSDERGYGGGERLGREWERGDPGDEERFDRDMRVRSYDEERFDRGGRGDERFSRDQGARGSEQYDERRRQRDYQPRYGHGPGVENMEPPRLGYSTSTTRGDDHEMGHGGFLGGGTYRSGAPKPTGRGPKGYTRSDERIRDDIFDHLMMSWMDAENVDIQVRNGEVTLKGTVRSRDEKRAIEALADSIPGVKDIINELRVPRGDQELERRSEGQGQTTNQTPGDTSLHS